MRDPNFEVAVAGRPWIVVPDPWASLEPGWVPLLTDTLDRIGFLMARRPDAVIKGLMVKEKFGQLRIRHPGRLPPDIEEDVRALWCEAEERSTVTCQFCGRPGRLRADGRLWLATACDSHA